MLNSIPGNLKKKNIENVYTRPTCEGPVEDGVEGAAVDVYEDGDVSVCAGVDAVEVDT